MNPEGLTEGKHPYNINILVVNSSAWMFHLSKILYFPAKIVFSNLLRQFKNQYKLI